MLNDPAHGRAVGTHPGSFSGGDYCRWTSWAQTDSNALCARSGPVDSQHRRAMAHAAAELPELQNCAIRWMRSCERTASRRRALLSACPLTKKSDGLKPKKSRTTINVSADK